jgi:glycosyltransferase involved in cell wall biosynthesis
MPTITLISTIYNLNPFVSLYIESINNQSDQDFDYILVDAFSQDNILESVFNNINLINKKYYKMNTRLSYHESIIYAIGKVESDYYFFLDTDDAIRVETIELFKNLIEISNSDMFLFEDSRSQLRNINLDKTRMVSIDNVEVLSDFLRYTRKGPMTSKLVKNLQIDFNEMPIENFRYSPDIFLSFVHFINCNSIVSVNKQFNIQNLYNYSSLNRRYNKSRISDYIIVYKLIKHLLIKYSLDSQFEEDNLERVLKELIYDLSRISLIMSLDEIRLIIDSNIRIIEDEIVVYASQNRNFLKLIFTNFIKKESYLTFNLLRFIGILYLLNRTRYRFLDKVFHIIEKFKYKNSIYDFKRLDLK